MTAPHQAPRSYERGYGRLRHDQGVAVREGDVLVGVFVGDDLVFFSRAGDLEFFQVGVVVGSSGGGEGGEEGGVFIEGELPRLAHGSRDGDGDFLPGRDGLRVELCRTLAEPQGLVTRDTGFVHEDLEIGQRIVFLRRELALRQESFAVHAGVRNVPKRSLAIGDEYRPVLRLAVFHAAFLPHGKKSSRLLDIKLLLILVEGDPACVHGFGLVDSKQGGEARRAICESDSENKNTQHQGAQQRAANNNETGFPSLAAHEFIGCLGRNSHGTIDYTRRTYAVQTRVVYFPGLLPIGLHMILQDKEKLFLLVLWGAFC